MSATRIPYPSSQPVYAAAARWRDECLLADRSLFSGGPGSTLAQGEELVRDFVERPDTGGGTFATKLAGQLATTSAGGVQLAGELLYVHLLIARSDAMSGGTKRALVKQVLGLANGTAFAPADLAGVLDAGLVRPGTAYGTYKWKLFGFLIEAFVLLKRQPLDERRRLLEDPAAFTRAMDALDMSQGARTQRAALEHLLFPDDFPPVVSTEGRAKIVDRWADLAGDLALPASVRVGNVYRGLASLTGRPDDFVNLWRAPYYWEWDGPPSQSWTRAAAWLEWTAAHAEPESRDRPDAVETATTLRRIRDVADAGDARWSGQLADALLATDLGGQSTCDELITWTRTDEPAARAALLSLWSDPRPTALDDFHAALPAGLLEEQGARLSISSLLRTVHVVEQQPPWRSRYVGRFANLVGYRRTEPTAPDSEVYDGFLALLDLVLDLLRRQGTAPRDRLHAQGLVRTTVEEIGRAHV